MVVINKDELDKAKRRYLKLLKSKVFIYPTDSIYGIGCDATNKTLVQEVRKIKKSSLQPFSVIVPSKEWVYKNCIVKDKQKKYVEMLGKKIDIAGSKYCFTLILTLKNKKAIANNVNSGGDTIGVRMPDHWISTLVKELGVPIVTTSANTTGDDIMTSLDDLNDRIRRKVEVIIYEGEKKGFPSTLIHLEDSK